MMPQISSLLSLNQGFESDELYSDYALGIVLPCIVQLVIAVGKDVLWKSLNHKILQMTRSKKKVLRMVALRSLQKLFTEVWPLSLCLSLLSSLIVLFVRWERNTCCCSQSVSHICLSYSKMTQQRWWL
jgi:hypothetical protein